MSDIVTANLCVYDPRSDCYIESDEPVLPRQPDCVCDKCFYGKDRLAVEIDRLRAEVADEREQSQHFYRTMVAIEADARRYRWIKDVALTFNNGRVEVLEFIAPIAYGENIDTAIDAALKDGRVG